MSQHDSDYAATSYFILVHYKPFTMRDLWARTQKIDRKDSLTGILFWHLAKNTTEVSST
jgi:hypothetical protein